MSGNYRSQELMVKSRRGHTPGEHIFLLAWLSCPCGKHGWKTVKSREMDQGLMPPGLTVIQPLSHGKLEFYCHNPLWASPLLPYPYHSLHIRSVSLPAGDGRVTESKCQPGLSDPPFDGELSLWRAKPNKASCRGLTCRDCSPSFIGSPPYTAKHLQILGFRNSSHHFPFNLHVSTCALLQVLQGNFKEYLILLSFCSGLAFP